MKLMNYNKLSMKELTEIYWEYEIEISNLASKYNQTEEYVIENSHILTSTDRHKLGILLWEVVNVLQCYNQMKKGLQIENKQTNVIPFPKRQAPQSRPS